jgi:hypothetical protein
MEPENIVLKLIFFPDWFGSGMRFAICRSSSFQMQNSRRKKMNRTKLFVMVAAISLVLSTVVMAQDSGTRHAFGFNSATISGFPTGSVRLTGGGAYNTASHFVKSAGGFRCTTDVNQLQLNGCKEGEGVRWDTADLLDSTGFKCTGGAGEALKQISTSADTAVLTADFYRASDGNDESFTANVIVSTRDIAPDIPGVQNVWIQGVGCGSAIVSFSN